MKPAPLDGTHLVAVRGLIHEVPARVRQRGELN